MRSLSFLLLATSLTIACGDEAKSNDSGSDAFGGATVGTATGGSETGGSETGGAETGGTETGGSETGGAETGSDGDDTAAPACTDFSITTMEGAAFPPSVVRLAVKIQCDGQPVTDKTEEDFSITEDGAEVSAFESDLSLVPTVTAFRLVTAMVLDMSGSIVDSGYLDDLQAAAQTFIGRLGEDQEVAIYLFDGRTEIQPLVNFTSDHDELNYAIHSLEDYEVYDPSTNLNGAVVEGLNLLNTVAGAASDGSTEASMVVFTDGADMAGRVSNEEAALAVSATTHSVYAVGLGAAVDEAHMTDLGKDGYYNASDIEALESAFDGVATSIRDEASSIYILAYCSPKRAGDHTLELQLTGTSASTTFDFNADDFDVGCDPTDFVPIEFLDADEDGFRPYDGDCDDGDATIYPGAPEIAGDEIDQDCDGHDDEIGGGGIGGDWWGSGEEGTGTDSAATDGGGGEETGGEETGEETETPSPVDTASPDDTGSPTAVFEITSPCTDALYPGTTAAGSLRDWTGGGGVIAFRSAAWRWDVSTNTARVLVTQSDNSCGDVIGTVTEGTYTGAATYIEISGWEDLGPGTHTVAPIGASSDSGPRISAAGYVHNGVEGTFWPLDGYVGSFETPIFGSISVMFVDEGTNFEATVRLYGGGPGEGVDGTFNACYCNALESLTLRETLDGGPAPL